MNKTVINLLNFNLVKVQPSTLKEKKNYSFFTFIWYFNPNIGL